MIKHISTALLGLAAAAGAHASVAYTSPDFNDIANPVQNAWCSGCAGEGLVSDQFSLASATTLGGVDFAVQADYGSDWNIELKVWDSSMSNVLYSNTFAAGSYSVTQEGNNVALISLALPSGPTLAAGDYRLSWYDVNLGIPGYANGTTEQQVFMGQTYQRTGEAFQIQAVPEPSTYALMLGGLALVGGLSRRRRS